MPDDREGPLYTLAEARAAIAREECRRFGHELDMVMADNLPVAISCGRCGGFRARVVHEEGPTELTIAVRLSDILASWKGDVGLMSKGRAEQIIQEALHGKP